MKAKFIGALVVSLCALAGQAFAHHSAAMFDFKKQLTVEGTIKEFLWTNPHGWITVTAADASGKMQEYPIELTSVNLLQRRGWRPSSMKAGDKVTIVYNPNHDATVMGGRVVSVTLPSGKVLTERDVP